MLRRAGDPVKGRVRGDNEIDHRVDAVWRVLRRRLLGMALLPGYRSVYVRVLPPRARKVEDDHLRGKQLAGERPRAFLADSRPAEREVASVDPRVARRRAARDLVVVPEPVEAAVVAPG